MTVIARKGLVGRVLEVTPVSSKVLLITDPLSAVSAVLGRSRNIGVIEGYSTDSLNLRFLGTGSEVAVGDQVATAAISSVVLPGIPIGAVVSARKNDADLFFEVRVKPAVDFGALETVYIVQ
jgi:rod shape-determining protein MreC